MGDTHALLFTDVVDSTKLLEQLGDAAMAALWGEHDRVARELLVVHNGREIDKSDGFLLLFDTAGDAVAYALAYHGALASLEQPTAARVGLHVGDVIVRENAPDVVARGAKRLEVEGLAKAIAARVMSVATGGQTLLTDAARRALGPTSHRVDSHGHWRMKGIADPIELFEVGGADAPFTPPPDSIKVWRVVAKNGLWLPAKQVKHSLPAERDAFVGRQADLQALARRLEHGASLVSVLGIGGTGKTRLVTRYGWSWLGDYAGGVWFCDLSEARTVEGVAYAVARGLDVPLGKDDPVVQLGHAIAGRGRCLVLLDNFEQVARHAPATLGRWLDRARDAQFVVTTREVLGLPGEETLALAPLPASEGVALFVARARSAKRDFEPDDVASIGALVDLLDGLPLAIELAAARVRVMSPKTLLHRMGERFQLLASSGGRHTRQATLRATLDWSWELLSPDEQRALGQLSVFEGGFTLEAAEAVLSLEGTWATDAVQALVDKSLVRPTTDGRFDLLVSVQEYAAEKLRGFEAAADAEARHGAWFASFGTDDAIDSLYLHGGVARGIALGRELDNLVAACGRAVTREDGAVAVALLEAAWAVLQMRGPFAAGIALAERVRGLSSLSAQERASTVFVLGAALHQASLGDDAGAAYAAALAVAREAGDRRREGIVLNSLGRLHREHGRMDDARAHYDAALAVSREVGDRRREGVDLHGLGVQHREEGRMDEARVYYDAALAVAREVGDRRSEGRVLNNLGELNRWQGRIADARAHYVGALTVAREVGDRWNEGITLGNLGILRHRQGRVDAQADYESALAVSRELGDRWNESTVLNSMASLHNDQGRTDEARACYESALAVAREVGNRRVEAIALGNVGELHYQHGRLDDAHAHFDLALAVARETGDRVFEGHVLGVLGNLWRLLGEPQAAIEHLTDALALHREVGFTYGLPSWLGGLALIEADAGRTDAALALMQEAVAVAAPFPLLQVKALGTLGRVHLARGEVPAAREAIARARALAPKVIAELAAVDALVAVAEGDRAAAEAALAEATVDPSQCMPGTEVAQLVAQARVAPA